MARYTQTHMPTMAPSPTAVPALGNGLNQISVNPIDYVADATSGNGRETPFVLSPVTMTP